MAVELTRAVFEDGPQDRVLTQVLLVLAYYSRLDGSGCYPSVDHIAKFCRLKTRIVIAALRKGEREDWLKRIKNSRRDKRASAYLLNVPRLLANQREVGANDSIFQNKVQSTTFSAPEVQKGANEGTKVGAIHAEIGANDSTALIGRDVRDVRRDVSAPTPQAEPVDPPTNDEKQKQTPPSISDEIERHKSERIAKQFELEEHLKELARRKGRNMPKLEVPQTPRPTEIPQRPRPTEVPKPRPQGAA
jgi:hypothetical protein